MAGLIDGKLCNDPVAILNRSGEFVRPGSTFRNGITSADVEKDRYHLYVSYACPWAHRTLITRKLKQLEDWIDVSVTDPYMGRKGWCFHGENEPRFLSELYVAADSHYTGKVTVPVLWDRKKKTILNNESAEIIRILNSAFDQETGNTIDLYPEARRREIDEINTMVYENVNNGVYRTGFASHQKAYESAFRKLFGALDELEERLSRSRFLVGDLLTEADIRLFTTLIRFDVVYHGHFKCNLRRIRDYHCLNQYLKSIYQIPEVRETVHFDHIKIHYYRSHHWINPNGIIPLGPELDLDSPHDRGTVEFHRKLYH